MYERGFNEEEDRVNRTSVIGLVIFSRRTFLKVGNFEKENFKSDYDKRQQRCTSIKTDDDSQFRFMNEHKTYSAMSVTCGSID